MVNSIAIMLLMSPFPDEQLFRAHVGFTDETVDQILTDYNQQIDRLRHNVYSWMEPQTAHLLNPLIDTEQWRLNWIAVNMELNAKYEARRFWQYVQNGDVCSSITTLGVDRFERREFPLPWNDWRGKP